MNTADVTLPPRLEALTDGSRKVTGSWTLTRLTPELTELRRVLATTRATDTWDLGELTALDSAGALLLLQAWHGTLPERLDAPAGPRRLLEEVAALPPLEHSSRILASASWMVLFLGIRV